MPTNVKTKVALLTIIFAVLAFAILLLPYALSLPAESDRAIRLFGGIFALVFYMFLMFVVLFSGRKFR